MAKPIRILAVVDPTATEQPGARRAAWLAQKLGARLELFVCDYDQYLAGERFFDSADLERAREAQISEHLERLAALKTTLGGNVEIDIDARWDHPLEEGIVRKIEDSKADIVFKDTHYHTVIKRSIFTNTDWSLIRHCPVPLWLVKPHAMPDNPTVVAAVDPVHERDKPADLDNRILELAQKVRTATDGKLYVFHAFDPSPAYAVSADSMAFPISAPINGMIEALRERHTSAMDDLIARHGIDKDSTHVLEGDTRELLIGLAEKHKADIVVMGAVSRSAIKRLFLGSTAEQLLDHIPCDLLIIKPAAEEED